MFCPSCGKEIPDGSTYCNYCGRAVYTNSAPTPQDNEGKKRNRVLKGICIALVIAIVLVACFFLFRSTPQKSTKRFLNAVKRQDWKTAERYYSGNPLGIGLPSASTFDNLGQGGGQFYQKLLDKVCDFDYTIDSVKVNGSTAQVGVTITTYDFSSFLASSGKALLKSNASGIERFFESMLGNSNAADTQDNTFSVLSSQLDQLQNKSAKNSCVFTLERGRFGRWKITLLGPDQLNALSGGLYSGLFKLIPGFSDSGSAASFVGQAADTAGRILSEAVKSFG